MRVRILGSSAGGGFPQWNCNCPNCDGLRRGRVRARARTQSSIAASVNDSGWVLFNASPDVHAQVRAFPELQPARGVRDTAIAGIVLTDGQVDHTLGLLMLREGAPLTVCCTQGVHDELVDRNPVLALLGHYCGVEWRRVAPGDAAGFQVGGVTQLGLRAVALSSKAPPYSPHREQPDADDTIGLVLRDEATGRTLVYAPGLGRMEPHLEREFERADCLLVDGTFWSDDELIRLGISGKRAREMGHLPQAGSGGMVEVLAAYPRARRILIHINNTNPILDEESAERARLDEAGIEVAYDGMEIVL